MKKRSENKLKKMVEDFEEYYEMHGYEYYALLAFLKEAYELGVKDAK